jgi:hypothetical protein
MKCSIDWKLLIHFLQSTVLDYVAFTTYLIVWESHSLKNILNTVQHNSLLDRLQYYSKLTCFSSN